MKNLFILCLPILMHIISSCKDDNTTAMMISNPEITGDTAEIVSVSTSGDENNYTFSVGIKSPDTGCAQYANWWEVFTEDGTLIYRRILAHSHVNEQPFVRTGGPVDINKDQIIYVRAHMNTSGYGTKVYKGSISAGFNTETLAADFASDLATTQPLPTGCSF
ncbi:hypothetical protein [Aquimarina sp. MMG016]|uniref:hypothetical protein n=1 Tax=Aquimarina sp. MMG016 TaxID=2822690 RepID=UPI001B3A058B|nr:hypothetical protein [Aquimarina sp. MMG016]MBQ4819463.1 hypothetical protein [Aquimarina sp. MMG016]